MCSLPLGWWKHGFCPDRQPSLSVATCHNKAKRAQLFPGWLALAYKANAGFISGLSLPASGSICVYHTRVRVRSARTSARVLDPVLVSQARDEVSNRALGEATANCGLPGSGSTLLSNVACETRSPHFRPCRRGPKTKTYSVHTAWSLLVSRLTLRVQMNEIVETARLPRLRTPRSHKHGSGCSSRSACLCPYIVNSYAVSQ